MFKHNIQNIVDMYFSLIRKYIPAGPQETSIGLDIGSHQCKAVEIVRSKKSVKIMNWGVEPVCDRDVLSAAQNLLKKINSESKDVFTGLSGQGTLIRFIRMPRMPITQLKDSLLIESDKYFPFPINEIYIDCQIIDDSQVKDNKMSVLVAVAKKDIVKDRLQMISNLGLQANFIGLHAIAIANAVAENQKDMRPVSLPSDAKKEAFAFLDIGDAKSTIIIFRDHGPRFTREIAIGGKDFTQKIMNLFSLDFQSAEKMKCSPCDKQEDVLKACHPVLMNLMSEVRLSFDYFSSEDGAQVVKILLAGQGARLQGVQDFLSKELEIPVQAWSPSLDLEFSESVNGKDFLSQADQLCVALGLALTKND